MALRVWAEYTNAKEQEVRELLPLIRFTQIGRNKVVRGRERRGRREREQDIKNPSLPFLHFFLFIITLADVDRLRNLVRPSRLGSTCCDLFKYYMDALVCSSKYREAKDARNISQ